tara:strand:+ start:258 stop:1325 length:1068 start_codon:yes stop_codon:yes gene_type:complete
MQGWFHTEIPKKVENVILDSVKKKHFTNGPETVTLEKLFEEKLKVKHALYTNSGTSALAMSLLSLDIGEGDEVIVPSIGWIATAQAVMMTGAKPIIVDTEERHSNISLEDLTNKISSRTKAIIPVNYNGRQVDIKKIKNKLSKNIFIVEDSCKSMFSRSHDGKSFSGTNGDCGCFSLGMISMLPSCYGGIVITNNSDIFEKLKLIKYHGVSYKPETYRYKSFNFKTTNLLASMGVEMFKTIDERIKNLINIYEIYEKAFKGTKYRLIPVNIDKGEIPLLIDVYRDDFNNKEIIEYLEKENIPTLGYHPSLSSAKYLHPVKTPNSDWLTSRTFHLPCGPDQKLENIEKAIEVILKF